MKDWEFLIQKQGEAWRSVPPSLELEPGMYRIAANAYRANLELEVSVAYRGEDSISYGRKQQRCTNEKGLVALMSWTNLEPGEWKLTCYGNIISELLGEGWQKSLQLQVVAAPITSATMSTEPTVAIGDGETLDQENVWEEVVFERDEEPSSQTILPIEPLEDIEPQPEIEPSSAADEELSEIELRLTLYEDTLIKRVGEPVLVSGQIEVLSTEQGAADDWELVQGKLRYLLRDPKTTQILLNLEQPISEQSLPLIFSSCLDIPFEASLLLGEVILEVPAENENEPLVAVARQAFAVTANLEELLETLIAQGDHEHAEVASASVSLRRIRLFDPQKSHTEQRLRTRTRDRQVLPPKISAATPAKTEIKLPSLPKTSALMSTITKNFESVRKRDRTAVDEAFNALKLEDRFWSRLSALKVEPEETEPHSLGEFLADGDDEN